MNMIEYLLGGEKELLEVDEYGNAYLCFAAETGEFYKVCRYLDIDDNTLNIVIPKEKFEKIQELQIVIADELKDWDSWVRRPYYRMRGKPVSKEQAFEIIRRTDNFFGFYIDQIEKHEDYISCMNFDNWHFMQNHYPKKFGWMHRDGTIGLNGITQTYPNVKEFVEEWTRLVEAFPYLDLAIGISQWDEIPVELWEETITEEEFQSPKYDKRFLGDAMLFLYVHDKTIEITTDSSRYEEYHKRYGSPREKFETEYYEKHPEEGVDREYLVKCIEAYGLDAEEELGKVSGYVLEGL